MSQKPTSDVKSIPIRSYGRRKSKNLRPTRTDALGEVMSWAAIKGIAPSLLTPATDHAPAQVQHEGTIDPRSFFDTPVKEVWFEIGFGNGEHLLQQALDNPDVGLIGCEPFINGVAALCVAIKEKNIKNIRIWPDDARALMSRLPDQSLDRFFLLHPDPWPKSRHHKRRFVQTETLTEIARLLKYGAEFRTATDHRELAGWMLGKIYFHPAFQWLARSADDWRLPPADWPETRYGKKGVAQGRPPVYFRFHRKAK